MAIDVLVVRERTYRIDEIYMVTVSLIYNTLFMNRSTDTNNVKFQDNSLKT